MVTTKRYDSFEDRLTLEQLVERDTKAGTLEIYVRPPYYDGDRHGLTTFLAGKWLTGARPTPLPTPQGQWTHAIKAGKIALALTAAEAGRIAARLAELNVAVNAAESRYQAEQDAIRALEAPFNALRSERRDLMAAHNSLIADQQDAFNRRWEREDEGGAFASNRAFDVRITAAAQAVADFDAAHPEVVARIRAERKAEVERFAAID